MLHVLLFLPEWWLQASLRPRSWVRCLRAVWCSHACLLSLPLSQIRFAHMSSSLWTWSTVFSYPSHPTRPTSCEYSVQRHSSDLEEDFTNVIKDLSRNSMKAKDCVLSLSWNVCQFVWSLPPHSAETGTWKATRLDHYYLSPSSHYNCNLDITGDDSPPSILFFW